MLLDPNIAGIADVMAIDASYNAFRLRDGSIPVRLLQALYGCRQSSSCGSTRCVIC
jgi:hypothetical protein